MSAWEDDLGAWAAVRLTPAGARRGVSDTLGVPEEDVLVLALEDACCLAFVVRFPRGHLARVDAKRAVYAWSWRGVPAGVQVVVVFASAFPDAPPEALEAALRLNGEEGLRAVVEEVSDGR